MRKLENKCIVWPVYFDALKTRGEGRKIPKKFALSSPKIEEIVEAAKALNLNPKTNLDARYPREWWQKSGYVVLDKLKTKNETLLALAKKMVELRKQKEFSRKV